MINKFEQKLSKILPKKESGQDVLSTEEKSAIEVRAEARIKSQKLKIQALNLEIPQTSEIKETYEKTKQMVFKEASGEVETKNKEEKELVEEADKFSDKAGKRRNLAPDLSAYLYALAAKNYELAEKDFKGLFDKANECQKESAELPHNTPSSLLPDAILLGISTRQIKKNQLPNQEKIAEAIINNPKLLENYSLVLSEEERAKFLVSIPEEKRKIISRAMDASVSRFLHQSIVENKSLEEAQRRNVRIRLYKNLREAVEKGDKNEEQVIILLSEALGNLGEDSRQLILEIIRDEYGGQNQEMKKEKDYLPRILKVFLENFDDWRGNDIALKLAGDKKLNRHLSVYILGKLIDNNYLSKDVKTWWSEEKAVHGKGVESEKQSLEIVKSVISDLGVVPSREILKFIADDKRWENIPLEERIEQIKSSQEKFAKIIDNHELASQLSQNENDVMIYYLLHGGDDRFNLINNYSFDRFKEMIGLINDLRIHEKPLRKFKQSLTENGLSDKEAEKMIANLKQGKFPLPKEQSSQEVSFDVSENALIENANREIGQVLGRKQLGVVFLFPLYREYLEQINNQEFIEKMKSAQTFVDRLALLDEIETSYPDFREKAHEEMKDNWRILGEKMILNIQLNQIFSEDFVPIQGEEILPRLDAKRFDLKKSKKDLVVLLKGGNEKETAILKNISKKRKARNNLLKGLEAQEDENAKKDLQGKIEKIEDELKELEREKNILGDKKIQERFAHMNQQEKEAEIERLGQEILALTEKSPSAIFTYITMQALGEERLRENDIHLIQELESHLQGPFQAIADSKTYQKPIDSETKKRKFLNLQYLDKTERFMNMVRFADSKICCFSSNNYEQTIQHQTPNKYWVASINADPLSFVISLEEPEIVSQEKEKRAKENLGFIFGSFGIDENGAPAILLNGIYYAPGIEDKNQVESILGGVEKIFKGFPLKTLAIAEQYGGSLGKEKLPEDFTNEQVELIRLRALDDNSGDPETKIYDDLNTGDDLNKLHNYGGNVWHKKLE
jgi:hypothetical protein